MPAKPSKAAANGEGNEVINEEKVAYTIKSVEMRMSE